MKKYRIVLMLICCLALLSSFMVFDSTVQAVSTAIDKCDSTAGWSGSDSVSLDTTNKKEGTGCLTKTGSGTDWFKKTLSPAVNSGVSESNGYIHLWLYVSDAGKLASTGAQLEITSSGGPDVNEYSWNLMNAGLVSGWNELSLKLSNAAKIGNPDLAAINFVRVYYFLTGSITCKLDDVYFTDGNGGGGLSDLIITDLTCSPASPQPGNAVTLSATVKNQGNAATPAGTILGVGFQIDGAATSLWSDNYTASLGPGSSVVLTVNGGTNGTTWTAISGTHTITAYVDDVNRIAESNESNNIFTKSITVGGTSSGDIVGKVIVGYQGWFDAPGDGAPANNWVHWANGSMPAPGNQNFEIYPDTREYTTLFNTGYANLLNGSPAKLFSSYSTQTVNKHFEWMQTYGIDGAAIQRFGGELSDPNRKAQRDSVTMKVKTASENYGRKFYVMYDISGMGSDFGTKLEADWTSTITGSLNLLSSSAYAKQNGKPVVCIWGMGFNDGGHPGDAAECISIINWFKAQGCYVIGGVPTYWRDCDNAHPLASDPGATNDSKTGFQNVYKAFNMIQPWMVGRIRGITGAGSADNFKTYIIGPDYNYCQANGIDYAPVIFPGFAWSNMHNGTTPKNEIPRLHGDFMWNQAYNTATLGITSAYIAMFDEYDEGTAIAKAAEDSSMIPTNQYFLTLDADGTHCTSDFYLRLTGDITKMLKGLIPKTSTHPTAH